MITKEMIQFTETPDPDLPHTTRLRGRLQLEATMMVDNRYAECLAGAKQDILNSSWKTLYGDINAELREIEILVGRLPMIEQGASRELVKKCFAIRQMLSFDGN